MSYYVAALCAGALLPTAVLIARYAVRRERLKSVDELSDLLYGSAGNNEAVDPTDAALPQLEFVRTKYDPNGAPHVSDVRGARSRAQPGSPRFPMTALYLAAGLFGLVCAVGFWPVLAPPPCGDATGMLLPSPLFSAATDIGGSCRQTDISMSAVIGAAFIGSYVGTVFYLSRRLLNFELSALSFCRALISLIVGALIAAIAYRSLNGGAGFLAEASGHVLSDAAPGFWLGAAFLIGLAPDAGLTFLARRLNLQFRKEIDDVALNRSRVMPTEVIDGVDSEIAFRLQESAIYDVQNLATYNPLQLYVETPFGLMQCFDWVLQAQLCVVAGRDAFFALKAQKIRTVFDLERAVLAKGVPEEYVVSIARIMLAEGPLRTLVEDPGIPMTTKADMVRHAVAVMTDDLHVHRLRSVWTRIRLRLSGPEEEEWLYDTASLPGERKAR